MKFILILQTYFKVMKVSLGSKWTISIQLDLQFQCGDVCLVLSETFVYLTLQSHETLGGGGGGEREKKKMIVISHIE